jgi:hypothetical protein
MQDLFLYLQQVYPITVGAGGAGGPNTPGPSGSPTRGNLMVQIQFFNNYIYWWWWRRKCWRRTSRRISRWIRWLEVEAQGPVPGGTGNTPPVSPPQGNPGGNDAGK